MAKRDNLRGLLADDGDDQPLVRGRGVAGMFNRGGQVGEPATGTRLLPLDLIDANSQQARQSFNDDTLNELADSIREHGVLQPIGVREVSDRYQIIYGERRYRASLLAEQQTIPATVHNVDDQQAAVMTALENLQREDLDIEDEARYFDTLIQLTGLSERALARKLGVSHLYINRRRKLLQRPDLLEAYRQGSATLHDVAALAGDEVTVSAGNTLERDELDEQSVSGGNSNTDPTEDARRYFIRRPYQNSVRRLQQTRVDDLDDKAQQDLSDLLQQMQQELDRLRGELASRGIVVD